MTIVVPDNVSWMNYFNVCFPLKKYCFKCTLWPIFLYVLKLLQELKNLDADKIAAREAEELQKERREQQQRLKMQEKKLDYFERAKRLEEIPLLKTAWKEKQV